MNSVWPVTIGVAARLSKVSAKMVRHYESLGLLSPVARTDSGYRQYSAADVRSLQFIKRIAQKHVDELAHRIEAMQRTLVALLDHCQGDERPDCPILDDLAGTCC
jgi:DNA-binding transcriptional MerR regulator